MSPARESGERIAGKPFELGDLKAAFQRFRDDQMNDSAAALTYYSLLSLFPRCSSRSPCSACSARRA